jgi:hypothetical protein
MDFARFMQMIQTKTLWFSRQDQFEDPLEGTYTDGELAHLHSLPKDPVGPDGSGIADGYLRGPKFMRATVFVNCWRSGSSESLAMWDLYGKGSGIIAVKTTVALLKQAMETWHEPVFVAAVGYIDWKLAPWDNNFLVMCARKDLSYQHESEVRAMIWNMRALGNSSELGIHVPFDPQLFLTEVVVGPREQGWITPLVKEVMATYRMSHPVNTSNRLKPRS